MTTEHTCGMTLCDPNFPRSYAHCGKPAYSVVRDLGRNLYLCKMHHNHVAKNRHKHGKVAPTKVKP